ncbi:MAG: hypothetical protein ACE5FJ_05515 [Gemmatimonadales bacterium]
MKLLLLLAAMTPVQEVSWTASPAAVTIGDSVWVTTTFALDPEERMRIGVPDPSSNSVVLERPEWTRGPNGATVQFVVALFDLGDVTLGTPPIELLTPDGSVRTLGPSAVHVTVASVIPAADSTPALRPGFDPIPRPVTRAEPFVFLLLTTCFIAYVWWSLRSRRHPRPLADALPASRIGAPLTRWADLGETRAVASVANSRLRSFLAERTSQASNSLTTAECMEVLRNFGEDLPVREIEELLRALDNVSFAPAVASDVLRIAEQVDDLISELSRPVGESASEDEATTLEVVR